MAPMAYDSVHLFGCVMSLVKKVLTSFENENSLVCITVLFFFPDSDSKSKPRAPAIARSHYNEIILFLLQYVTADQWKQPGFCCTLSSCFIKQGALGLKMLVSSAGATLSNVLFGAKQGISNSNNAPCDNKKSQKSQRRRHGEEQGASHVTVERCLMSTRGWLMMMHAESRATRF